jgi:hypothetical protein
MHDVLLEKARVGREGASSSGAERGQRSAGFSLAEKNGHADSVGKQQNERRPAEAEHPNASSERFGWTNKHRRSGDRAISSGEPD